MELEKSVKKSNSTSKSKGKAEKPWTGYLVEPTDAHVSHSQYLASPATAFLTYLNEVYDTVNHCQNNLTTNKDGNFSKTTQDSLQNIVLAMLPAVMSHYETYQKYLFAGLFDRSGLIKDFNVRTFLTSLGAKREFEIDPFRLSSYRQNVVPVGIILADSLKGWSDPKLFDEFLGCFVQNGKKSIISNKTQSELKILWQLRHSIAHTGGTLTLGDAQKVKELTEFGNRQLAFDPLFINALTRKFHVFIQEIQERLITELCDDQNPELRAFLSFESSKKTFFK